MNSPRGAYTRRLGWHRQSLPSRARPTGLARTGGAFPIASGTAIAEVATWQTQEWSPDRCAGRDHDVPLASEGGGFSFPSVLPSSLKAAPPSCCTHLSARPSRFGPAPLGYAFTGPLRVLYRGSVARDRRGCDHGFLRWGGRTSNSDTTLRHPAPGAAGSSRTAGGPILQHLQAPGLRFPPVRCHKVPPSVLALSDRLATRFCTSPLRDSRKLHQAL